MSMNSDKYYIWERNDGHVGSSANRMPSNDANTTFKFLELFDNWEDAYEYIEELRLGRALMDMRF